MTPSTQYTWHKIADNEAALLLASNNMTTVYAGNKKVCIAKHRESLYACAEKCPHAGGIMADGYTDALGNIVCPLHRYKFDLKTGRNTSGEGYFLKHYPVETRADGIYVGIEEKSSLFGW